MKLLYDFFPIILFFVAFKLDGIYTATLVAIVASVAQLGFYWLKHKRFENMHLISGALIVALGGLTIALQDKAFIMWKPTLVNWLFALVFAGSFFVGKKPLIERMLGGQLQLPKPIWRNLNWSWVGFFVLSGVANLYFALDYLDAETALRAAVPAITDDDLETFTCDAALYLPDNATLCQIAADKESLWVNFKLFGLMGLMVIFVIAQAVYMSRYMSENENTSTENQE
ncbi:MAG: septation protein A [Pseudomonadota bacterium]